MKKPFLASLAAALLAAACVGPANIGDASLDQPEASTGYAEKPGWANSTFAVAAANPLAAEAGSSMLKAGGSAIDAAVAVQMVLGLVEPQSSGIGGGAFLLHFNGREVEAFDGRETAPAAADERLFLHPDGRPMAFREAVVGGRAVGVPGVVRMLEAAHRRYGKLPWADLFQPAIALAEKGFPVGPRLHALARADDALRSDAVAAAYFFRPDGEPHAVGSLLRNPDYAAVLRRIARDGARALYEGPVAQAIVDKVRGHRANPGRLALSDLAHYEAKQRAPLCHEHRAARVYLICGFPPPGSGAIAIGQILGILGNTAAADHPPVPGRGGIAGSFSLAPDAEWLHLYTEAARLAFADRAQYVADPDFVTPPAGSWASLLDAAYLRSRAALIGSRSMKLAQPGVPGGARSRFAPMPEQPEHGTSHLSIVDADGNAVAMTTSIENQFGSRQMVNVSGAAGGFLLNNELTDFSFSPTDSAGKAVANRVQPGKRPRSSMSPTLVFDRASGALVMSTGSPGGAMIIHFTAKVLYGVLDWGMNAQQAIDLPNFGSLGGPVLLEAKRFPPSVVQALRARGAVVREQPLTSGLQAIQTMPGGWFGGADPRREGVVAGE
ncbi:MAG: gamma-glutamyltranspeptidase precursor-like protein [Ramlibacter sp.]|jgi:gamma-glutamyltranspeptidase/glutathione hydrolase|nr:gamma-glutamyltranspeptidase precursor-like protein [Ramlibacter sp.]